MEVSEDECIGCGTCAAVCPYGIEMKDRKAVVKDSFKCSEELVAICPVGAIK